MSGVSVLRGFRPKKKRSKHNSEQDMHDALKIDWRQEYNKRAMAL